MKTATLKKDLAIILGASILLTIISILFELDQTLAKNVYNTQSAFALFAKEHLPTPFIGVSVLLLIFILIPPLRNKYPTLNRVALVWLFTLVFGAGLLVHNILKESVERPRPRTTVILDSQAPFTLPFNLNGKAPKEFHDKSFPSGHVATATMLMVPFFVLRRRKPKLAKAFLVTGVVSGALMGYGRMIYGAHFFTDVLWAITSIGVVAAIGSHFIKENTELKTRHTLLFILITAISLAWFNDFTKVRTITAHEKNISFEVPCDKIQLNHTPLNTPYVATVTFTGIGGPTKSIKLTNAAGVINYKKIGLFRHINCQAQVWIPKNTAHKSPSIHTSN